MPTAPPHSLGFLASRGERQPCKIDLLSRTTGARGASISLQLIILALMAGCSVSTAAAPKPTPTANLGHQYLALVAPANSAEAQFEKTLQTFDVTGSAIRSAAKTLSDALVTFNSGLVTLQAAAPPSIRPDIVALRQSVSLEISDLQAVLDAATQVQVSAALKSWDKDARSSAATAVSVRSDLGLPPPAPIGNTSPISR